MHSRNNKDCSMIQKKQLLALLFPLLLLTVSCEKSEKKETTILPKKDIASVEQQWMTFIKEGGYKAEPHKVSEKALNLFIEANKTNLTTLQIEDLKSIGSCDIAKDNIECHYLVASFIADNTNLRDQAIKDAENTFSALSSVETNKKNDLLVDACKSDIRGLLWKIPSQYWPSSRLVLLTMLYPISGGKERSSDLEKELLRVYLTGVIDNRWNSGEIIQPMQL